MKMSKIFRANLIREILLFALLAVILSTFFSLTLQANLVEEFTNRGLDISNSIANSSVELLLNRDASTIQATIDQFTDLDNDVAYIFVVDDSGEFIAHTFTPSIPSEILAISQGERSRAIVRDVTIANRGNFINVTSPILAGVVGYVHVGMDKQIIAANIQSAIFNQVLLIAVIFLIGVGIAYFQTNQVSRPLMQLANYARSITHGSISTETLAQDQAQLQSIAKRDDEVGQLTLSLQHMLNEIRDREQNLEQQVIERTRRLEILAALSERLNAILDFDRLLLELVNQVKESFDYYHAHVYIIDDKHEYLVMAAGAGEAGAKMKDEGHKIPVTASTSLVASAVRNNEVVSVANVREAKDWLPNELLPNTYAEMAVPIILEEQVVGVLDVQEDKVGGLDEGDASVLRSLANQVAVAIRNARLFDEVRTSLAQAHIAQERYVRQAWDKLRISQDGSKHLFTLADSPPPDELKQQIFSQVREQVLEQGNQLIVTIDQSQQQAVATPIRLKGQTIGALQMYNAKDGKPWTENDKAMLEAIIDQFAQTAENLRLFDETRERAEYERLAGEISEKLRQAPNLEALTKIAGQELSRVLGVSHSIVKVGSTSEKQNLANSPKNGHQD